MHRPSRPDNPRVAALHDELDQLRVQLGLLVETEKPDPAEVGRLRLAILDLENRTKNGPGRSEA